MKIAVAGIGYVGLANAVLLARNHDVVMTDIIQEKVDSINASKSLIVDKEIELAMSTLTLSLKASIAKDMDYSQFDYIIIATPTDYDAKLDAFNTSAVEEVLYSCICTNTNATIVIRSTIPIGFTLRMNELFCTDRILFAPEFLREGKALYDALNPSRIVVGGETYRSHQFVELLRSASNKQDAKVILTGAMEAESIKLFSNAYLAMRVSYINEMDTFAALHGLDSRAMINGICLDPRIGDGYNNPSFGYGGYCLPKDTKQLRATFNNVPSNIIPSIVDANASRKRFIADELMKTDGIIGFHRLIMKSDSDNFRESSVFGILEVLSKSECKVLIYEPLFNAGKISGYEVCNNLFEFKERCSIIAANRQHPELADVAEKVYTRDIFGRD